MEMEMEMETPLLHGKHIRAGTAPEHRHIDGLVAASSGEPDLYRWSPVPQSKTDAINYIKHRTCVEGTPELP